MGFREVGTWQYSKEKENGVKEHIRKLEAKVKTSEMQGVDLKCEGFGTILTGGSGTGKTTFANQYAAYLHAAGLVSTSTVKSTTGIYLADGGISRIKNYIENMERDGGILFIDDAHFLLSSDHSSGIKVLDYLLQTIPLHSAKIAFILAGTEKGMRKVIGHGGHSTATMFQYLINFEDFKDEELVGIFGRVIKKKWDGKMIVEGGEAGLFVRVATRRVGRGRGMERFGNARAVEALVGRVWERQVVRRAAEREKHSATDSNIFTKEDILGPDPSNAVLNSPAWTQLQKLTGLEKVKDSILSLLELVKANYQREMEEKPLLKVSLNRLFLGPPGTGKTLVAKIYGQLLAEIGILSKGEVLLRNPSDLIGQYIGDSEANTKAALNAAIGNVLVIDEAYMMYSGGSDGTGNESDSYRQGIMDTLVGEIQSTPGEDRCVLLLGYDTAMEEMLQNSNPGLARRFPLADAFRFQNFTAQELESILRSKLADDVLEATDEAIRVAMDVLEKASQRANFGNGGEVENLISKAKTNYQSRASTLPIADRPKEWIFLPQDFDPSFDRQKSAPSNLRKLFADVVGCESVIHKLETYQRVALAMKSRDLDPREYIPTNFVFKGPPGTGKTTTARKLASVYYDMGLLAEPSVVECSASDLIGKYIGHSGPKTAKVFEKALGRVLFIDEAYRLADGGKCSYASEVVSELVDLMTKEKYKGKIVVVLAGYEDEMNGLLGMNPGLASRFPEEICFANLSPETCVEILNIKIRQAGIGLGFLEYVRGANAEVTALMKKFVATKGWGNARDVETLAKGICRGVFASLGAGGELVCTRDVVVGVLRGMLGERMKRGGDCVDEETVWGNSRIRGTDNRKMMMADRRTGQRKLERVKEKLPGEVKKVGELEVFLASGMQ
ncbi:P-loop containing nucleoside triphosphate hydrolase protein [Cadophora sp. DSE1049]|nr:P-loop containing nucleoside triphosphate hydrolase protein [Cadophora sp. DSE1049]